MRWLILFGLWLAYMTFGAIVSSLAPLVPIIRADLGISNSQMGSILGAWQVIYIFSAIPAGILLDRIGGRWALIIGLSFLAISACGRALSDNYLMFLFSVMAFGLGGPIISSGAPKIVTSLFQGSQRGLAMGIYMTGPILGGIICLTMTHSVLLPALGNDWRNLMFLWGGVAAIVAIIWITISSLDHSKLSALNREISSSKNNRPKNLQVIGSIVSNRSVKVLLVMAVGAFLINHGLNNWLPELLRNNSWSLAEASYWAALPMAIGILSSLIIPRLATPERRFTILTGLCLSACLASLTLMIPGNEYLIASLIMQGFVRASLMTVLILTLMELPSIKSNESGTASGLFFSAAEVGGVLGPLGLGILYDVTGGFSAGLYTLAAIAAAMAIGAMNLSKVTNK